MKRLIGFAQPAGDRPNRERGSFRASLVRPTWMLLAVAACASGSFVDVTDEAGIRFEHSNAKSEEKYLVETMGSGCAFFDYNQDGFLDVFFVNGGPTPSYQPEKAPKNALYRSNGDGTFAEVTAEADVGSNRGFGMGAFAGDFDNDGYPDLYISGYGSSTLYHNNRDGTFTDVTDRAGVANRGRWGSASAPGFPFWPSRHGQGIPIRGSDARPWFSSHGRCPVRPRFGR